MENREQCKTPGVRTAVSVRSVDTDDWLRRFERVWAVTPHFEPDVAAGILACRRGRASSRPEGTLEAFATHEISSAPVVSGVLSAGQGCAGSTAGRDARRHLVEGLNQGPLDELDSGRGIYAASPHTCYWTLRRHECRAPVVRVSVHTSRSLRLQLCASFRSLALLAIVMLVSGSTEAAAKKESATKPAIPASFAPMDPANPLANIWNDPEFTRRLMGSYGFLSDVEPRLNPEEQADYRDHVLPLIREDQEQGRAIPDMKSIPALQSRIKPSASPLFDYLLGNIYFQNEDFTNAVKYFEQATAKHPDFLRAWKQLGFLYVRDGRYQEAIQPLSKTISLGGGDGKTFGLLGYSYMNAGRYVSAEAAYRQAMIYEPDTVDFKLGIVKCLVATQDYNPAIALLDEMITAYPENDSLWKIQANIFLQTDQNEKAAVNYEVLRRLDMATPEMLATLGNIYMTQEATELALEAYRQSIEKDGWQNPSRALRAADILVSRGAWTEAGALIAKIRSVAGGGLADDDEMKLLKLESKIAMAKGEGEKAIGVLEKISERNPLDGEALLLAGDYFLHNGELEKAEFRYNQAAKIQGFEADAFVKQAQLLVRSAKYIEAVEALKKAQRIEPRDNVQRYLDKVEELARTSHS